MSKHTELQTQSHMIQACDATTGHSVQAVAMTRDTETAKHLVYRFNNHYKLLEALEELVECKAIKDTHGKTDEYLHRQPIAWLKAIALIKQAKGE